MLGIKKLKKRIKSLEEELGYVYSENDSYDDHSKITYGEMSRIEKRLSDLEDKLNPKK